MIAKNSIRLSSRRSSRGFTLVELLVVIAIIAILTSLVVGAVRNGVLKAQKARCTSIMRDVTTGLQQFSADYMRPPIPVGIQPGTLPDVIFGDSSNRYTNDYIIAVLEGEDKIFSFEGGDWNTRSTNPKLEQYVSFARNMEKKNGVNGLVGDPQIGQIFDPWGRPLMIGINVPPFTNDRSGGMNDSWMETYSLGVYPDSEPRYENYVIWSYGKDGAKGTLGKQQSTNRLAGSDDVVSW